MSLLKWIEKNPLEAAALGTAAYMTGGAALGAMGGGAAATGATGAASAVPIAEGVFAGATPAELLAANSGGAAAVASGGGMSGLLGSVTQAAGAANVAKGLMSSPQSPAPQVSNQTDGGAGLSQLYGHIQQGDAQRMQEELAKRAKMQGLFGGGYGAS